MRHTHVDAEGEAEVWCWGRKDEASMRKDVQAPRIADSQKLSSPPCANAH